MTPAARVAAAITVLDDVLSGRSAEQALSAWGRQSRFAGSKDRAALRDLVFDALRRRASCAALGGGMHGRGLMLGLGVQDDWGLDDIFSGEGHAPDPLTPAERDWVAQPAKLTPAEAADVPDWIWDQLQTDLGDQAGATAAALRQRAALFLRVNLRRGSVDAAVAALAAEEITCVPHPSQEGCLVVTQNPRRVQRAAAYLDGLVEIQDAASQIAVAGLDIPAGATVLDYCAGGGGKALAIADRFDCDITAHDIAQQRMQDIAPRAKRGGVQIDVAGPDDLGADAQFDVVVVDAPCSGSGTWRRNPEAKWALTPEKLQDFSVLQGDVLSQAMRHLRPGGQLVYMTCSVFRAENEYIVKDLVASHDYLSLGPSLRLLPTSEWDGFFCHSFQLLSTSR